MRLIGKFDWFEIVGAILSFAGAITGIVGAIGNRKK